MSGAINEAIFQTELLLGRKIIPETMPAATFEQINNYTDWFQYECEQAGLTADTWILNVINILGVQ